MNRNYILFIETTWDRFTAAEEINDLYASGADGLFVSLKDEGFWPEREFELREEGVAYVVDLAIQCQEGTVAIAVGDRAAPSMALRDPDLEAVQRAVEGLGGEQPVVPLPQDPIRALRGSAKGEALGRRLLASRQEEREL
jgi:hypothetical protein